MQPLSLGTPVIIIGDKAHHGKHGVIDQYFSLAGGIIMARVLLHDGSFIEVPRQDLFRTPPPPPGPPPVQPSPPPPPPPQYQQPRGPPPPFSSVTFHSSSMPLLSTDRVVNTVKLWPLSPPLQKNKGGNKSKTRRRQRQRQRQNKRNRKNKYSRRRRNAKC